MSSEPSVMHIVLVKWREDADEAAIARFESEVVKLKDVIPGILEMSCGRNFCTRSQGYETALVARFSSRAALEAYSPHPAHRKVVEDLLNPIRVDSIAVDYQEG